MSSRSEKLSLVNSAEARLSLVKFLSSPSHKKVWRTIFFRKDGVSSDCLSIDVKCSFNKRAKIFCNKSQQFLLGSQKRIGGQKLFRKIKLLFWRFRIVLTTVRTKYCQKSNFFPLNSKSHIDKRKMFFWNNCYFFKTSPRTGRMQPRRTCRTSPLKVRQIFV